MALVLPAAPESGVLLPPMELEPVEPIEPVEGVVEEEPIEPVEGLVEEEPGDVVVSSVFLLHPAIASAAAKASATATAVPDLNVGAFIPIFPFQRWRRLTISQKEI